MASRWQVSGEHALAPLRCALIALVVYNGAAISLAQTETTPLQLLLLVGSAIAFAAGVPLVRLRPVKSAPRDWAPLVAPFWALLLATAPAAALMFALILQKGVPALAADVNAARVAFFGSGFSSTIVIVPFNAVLVSSLVSAQAKTTDRKRYLAVAAFCLFALAATGNRGVLLGPLLCTALYYCWERRVNPLRIAALALIGLVGFSYAGYARNIAAYGSSYVRDLNALGYEGSARYLAPAALYLAGTSETFDRTLAYIPDHVPYQNGTQFLGPFLHKPSIDLFLKDIFNLNFTGFGLAVGSMNAFYVDWGFPGIIAGFFVLGMVSGYLFRQAQIQGSYWVLGYAFWLANLLLSNYGSIFAYLATIATPVLSLLLLKRGVLPRSTEEVSVTDFGVRAC